MIFGFVNVSFCCCWTIALIKYLKKIKILNEKIWLSAVLSIQFEEPAYDPVKVFRSTPQQAMLEY